MNKPMQSSRDFFSMNVFYKTNRNKTLYRFSKDSKQQFEKFMSEVSQNQNSENEATKTKIEKQSVPTPGFDSLDLVQRTSESSRFPQRKKRPKSPDNYNFETSETRKMLSLATTQSPQGKSGTSAFLSPIRASKEGEGLRASKPDIIQPNPPLTDRQARYDANREKKAFFRLENYGTSTSKGEKPEFISNGVPNTDRVEYSKERQISDVKMESHRIIDNAIAFKDLDVNSNPAYELAMPKHSSRSEKKQIMNIQSSHDVSYLTNIRTQTPNRKVLPRLFESTNSKISSVENFERSRFESVDLDKKFLWGSPSSRMFTFKEAITPNSKRISNFFEPVTSPFQGKEEESTRKDAMRHSAVNFTRRIKKFGSEDLTQALSPQNPLSTTQRDWKIYAREGGDTTTQSHQEPRDEFSTKSLIHSLKKELPNILLDAPSTRNDVSVLSKWADSNLERIRSHTKLHPAEKIQCTDELYKFTLNELIRQISCDCIERGELFMKIWKSYMNLFDDLVAEVKASFEQKIKAQNDEFTKAQKAFAAQLDSKAREVAALNALKDDLEFKLEGEEQKASAATFRYKCAEDDMKKMGLQIKTLKRQFKSLTADYEDIHYKYNKLRADTSQKEDDDFDPEEFLQNKYKELQAVRILNENETVPEIKNISYEKVAKVETEEIKPQANFGTFVGRKILYSDQETQYDKVLVMPETSEAETQTYTLLIHSKFDGIFENMAILEEFAQEEQLKQQIKEENLQNLEEDLQEEIYEQEYKKMKRKLKPTETEDPDRITEDPNRVSEDMSESQLNISLIDEEPTTAKLKINNAPRQRQVQKSISSVGSVKSKENRSREASLVGSLQDIDKLFGQNSGVNIANRERARSYTEKSKARQQVNERPERHTVNIAEFSRAKGHENEADSQLYSSKDQSNLHHSDIVRQPSKSLEPNRLQREVPKIEVKILPAESPSSKRKSTQEIPSESSPQTRRNKSSTSLQSPARKIQGRIIEKLRKGQIRRKTAKLGSDYNIRSLADLKEVLDENSDEDGSQLQSSIEIDKQEIMESITSQHFKYVRMAKMLKYEKAKTAEFAQFKKVLAYIAGHNNQLYQALKEQVEAMEIHINSEIDKEKVLKVLVDQETNDFKDTSILLRGQSGELLRGQSGELEIDQSSEIGTSVLNARPQIKYLTENLQVPGYSRLKFRTLTSKIEEEPKSALKTDQELNVSPKKRRKSQRSNILRTTILPTLSIIQSLSKPLIQPALGKKREPLAPDKKAGAMTETLAKLRKLIEKNRKKSSIISVKKVLKLITSFTVDKIYAAKDNANVRDQDMMYFVYTSLYNTYAMAKIAESKFVIFMNSMKSYPGIQRVENFMRLCGLMEPSKNWTPDESKQFMLGYEFLLLQQKIGMSVQNSEHDKRHYTPFVRAAEYAKQFCEKRHLFQELIELKKELEANREKDSVGHNRTGVIKIDMFLELIVKTYRKYKEKVKETLKPVFEACNFVKAPLLGYDEFCILVRSLEPEKYDLKKLGDMFANCEEVVEDFPGISLDKFVVIAIELELFSVEKQRKYVGANDENEIRKNFGLLKEIWNEKKNQLSNVIEFNKKSHSAEVIEYWTEAIESLDLGSTAKKTQDIMCCLLRYRLMVGEINSSFKVNISIYKE